MKTTPAKAGDPPFPSRVSSGTGRFLRKIDQMNKPNQKTAQQEFPQENETDNWFDKQDIMTKMYISSRTLQRWRTKGVIPFVRIGRKIYYKESDLKKLFNRNRK